MNYVVLDAQNSDENYQVKMLTNNDISSFLTINTKYINNNKLYYYDITSKQPIYRLYEYNPMKWEDVENICINISRAMRIVKEYMLELDSVMFDVRFMYMDVTDRELYFMYYPDNNIEFSKKIKELFEFILEHLDHSDKKNVIRAYDIYQRVLQNQLDFEDILSKVIAKGESQEIVDKTFKLGQEEYIVPTVMSEEVIDEKEVINKNMNYIIVAIKSACIITIMISVILLIYPRYNVIKINAWMLIGIIGISGMIFKKVSDFYRKNKGMFTKIVTTSNNIEYEVKRDDIEKNEINQTKRDEQHLESSQTMLLADFVSKKNENTGCVLRNTDKGGIELQEEKILISKNIFIIGSFTDNCDYVISNELISRMHLRIRKVNDKYFIQDLNSTNGTYVNGRRLDNNEELQLHNKDILKIAILEYYVEINEL